MAAFRLRWVAWSHSADRDALGLVRRRVFIEEQQVPEELEWDEHDSVSDHLLAEDEHGTPIGCARLLPDFHIGRMAVLPPWRGQGVGTRLLEQAISRSRERGAEAVALCAQTHAQPFYQRFGFVSEGLPYMDAGIPHRDMRLRLVSPTAVPVEGPPGEFAGHHLGQTHAALRLDRRRHYEELLLRMAQQATHQLYIFTPSLDPWLFASEALQRACFDLARRSRRSHVFLVVHDTRTAVQQGSRLIELAKNLSSYVQIRNPGEEHRDDQRTLIIADQCGYILRRAPGRYEGEADFNNPRTTQRHLEYFQRVWQYATPDPYTRSYIL